MKQLTIYDFISETNSVTDEVFEIIKYYLINHGKNNEYFIYEFDHYSQLLNKKTKIAISCISHLAPCCVDIHLFNGNVIHNIRLFKDNCIIEDDLYGSNNYSVIKEVCFQNYDKDYQIKRMKEFLKWKKCNSLDN